MCTVVVLNGVRADFPLVLATNRDEFFARATSGPQRLLDAPRTVGGRDLVAQGTWMGVTEQGLFVGITNQRTRGYPDRNKRSRGELVMNALRANDRDAIARMLMQLDGRDYNAFNLLWGDADELWVAYGREHAQQIAIEQVPRGIHVLPNDVIDSADFPKVQRAISLVEPYAQSDFATLSSALQRMLADRERPALSTIESPQAESPLNQQMLRELAALCIRMPNYGTRSSTVVALERGRVGHYLYADGPPDQTEFRDVTGLYRDYKA